LTPDQCAERMQEMMQQYYDSICNDCVLPGGGRVIRIGFDGHFEELVEGAWVAPQGDYALPGIAERTGGTPEELRCLAAANAENVLAELYEYISDQFALGVSVVDALGIFAAAIGATIVAALGLLAGAVMTLALIAFGEFFAFLDFLTEDVWTEDFSEALRCIFYECSLIDAEGVVTFDIDCVWQKLQDVTGFDLDTQEIRLLGQVGYLLSIIGVDGLNLAGATTAVETADCSACSDEWCFSINLQETDGDATPITVNGCTPTWVDGVGWVSTKGGGCAAPNGQAVVSSINITYPSTFITKVIISGESHGRTGGNVCAVGFPGINRTGTFVLECHNIPNDTSMGVVMNINALSTGITAEFQCVAPSGGTQSSGEARVHVVTFHGTGECPFGIPNCLPE